MIFTYVEMNRADHWQHVRDSIDDDSSRTVASYVDAYNPTMLAHLKVGIEDLQVVFKQTIFYRDIYMP